jgi:transposase InsO family protein
MLRAGDRFFRLLHGLSMSNGIHGASRPGGGGSCCGRTIGRPTRPIYVAFVIDAVSLRIVAGQVQHNMTTSLVPDDLEQALYDRQRTTDLVVHSDHGLQYVSLAYTHRLAEAGATPSVGNVRDVYD